MYFKDSKHWPEQCSQCLCFCGECYQIVLTVVLECSVQYPRVPSSSSKGPAVIPYSAVLDPPQGFGRPPILMHLPWPRVISLGLWILSPWFACTFKWFGSWYCWFG